MCIRDRSVSGNGGDHSSTAGSDDSQDELKLPSGKELIKILRLPDSVTALIQRRDKNKDGQLTIGEFAYAPTKELLKRQEHISPSLISMMMDSSAPTNSIGLTFRRVDLLRPHHAEDCFKTFKIFTIGVTEVLMTFQNMLFFGSVLLIVQGS